MEGKRFDAVAVGECLVDCLVRQEGAKLRVEGNPGGAPCNVLAAMSRLGMSTAFIGKLGEDVFGRFLQDMVEKAGVSSEGIVFTEKPTTLAIVSLDEKGNRDFSFMREHTADVELREDEVNKTLIDACRIFHFGTVSMTDEPARSATMAAAEYAKGVGAKLSFDPNLRPALWKDMEQVRPLIDWSLQRADYVKLSDEEQTFITGIQDPVQGGRALMERYPLELLAVTMGPKGLVLFNNGLWAEGRSYDVDTRDTTGAGDAMWGGTLAWLLKNTTLPVKLDEEQLQRLVRFANGAGSVCTTRYGAITAMPSEEEILACVAGTPELPV